jgi:3-dehydroquinate synthase
LIVNILILNEAVLTQLIKLNIDLGSRSYPIYMTGDYSGLPKCLHSAKVGEKIVIITDKNVDIYQSKECIQVLNEAGFHVDKYVIEAGERSKNLDVVKGIYEFLVEKKLDRNSTVVALGGGVVGDITGFVAATFLRGIQFVQVPTTLLAQADSSVGGKVGVDFLGAKNLIGSFYQPKLVYINVNSLKTLPKPDFISGLAEVIKHGIIKDSEFYEYLDYNSKKILDYDEDVLLYMAKINCSIKGSVVEKDEREKELRAILNFGHTIGHAIESIMNFKMLHGECVSLGMVGALKIAQSLEMLDKSVVENVERLLERVGLPIRFEGIDVDKVYNQMFYDKKVQDNKLMFVLPRKIGEVVLINVEDEDIIKQAIYDLGRVPTQK